MMKFCLIFVLVGFCFLSTAQVKNNNIKNRLSLVVDDVPLHSTTANSSVEWNCINKALTNKCLIYHNDQWFDFSVKDYGTYFINISAQRCRENLGIQAIIIEGNPCEIKTYKILRCINKIRQDDLFIQLDSLKPGISYLINIDGYLADFCDFKIQVSKRPEGLPLHLGNPDTVRVQTSQQSWKFSVDWKVNRSRIDDFERFRMYRHMPSGIGNVLVNDQPVRRNTFGASVLDYSASDSLLAEGIYIYRVFGIQRETLVPNLLLVREVDYIKPAPKIPMERFVKLTLDFPDKTQLKILMYDRATDAKLFTTKHEFNIDLDKSFEINLGEFLDKGIMQFLILVSDDKAKEALEFYYRIDGHGKLIKE